MLTVAIHRRARKLAGLTVAEGPEGEGAKRRLLKLIAEHPQLIYLDCDDPMCLVEERVGRPCVGQMGLLKELCYRYEVALAEIESEVWLFGRQADVRAAMSAMNQIGPSLDRFLHAATIAWLLVAKLPDLIPRSTDPPKMEITVAEDEDLDMTEPRSEPEPDPEPVPDPVVRLLQRAAKKLWRR